MTKTDLGTTPTSPKHPPPPTPADIRVTTWQPVQGPLVDDLRVAQAVKPRPQMDARNDLTGWDAAVESLVLGIRERHLSERDAIVTPQDWGWGRGEPGSYPEGSRHPRRDDTRYSLVKATDKKQAEKEWRARSEIVWPMLAERLKATGTDPPEGFRFDYEGNPVSERERLMEATTYEVIRKYFPKATIGNWIGGDDVYMPVLYHLGNGPDMGAMMRRYTREVEANPGKTICPYVSMPGEMFYSRDREEWWPVKTGVCRFFVRWLYKQGVREFFFWQSRGPDIHDWEDLHYIIDGL